MKIVHLVDEYHHSLKGYQETALPIRQHEMGHDVHVITGNRVGLAVKTLSKTLLVQTGTFVHDGVKIHRLPVLFRLPGGANRVYLKGLASKLSQLCPDVVHAHNFITFVGWQAALLKPYIGYRLVYDNHQCLQNIRLPNTSTYTALLRDLFYEVFRIGASGLIRKRADIIIAVGENEREYAADYLGLSASQIPIIRLGADHHVLKPSFKIRQYQRAKWGFKDTDFLAIYAGQFRPLRQLELLIQASQQLVEEGFPVYLMLVGTGYSDYLAKLKELANQPLLFGRVQFLPLADKPTLMRYFNAADLGVWPRSYSVTFIEALACGLPILAEDSSYNRNTIGSAGYFFEPGSITSITNQLRNIIKKPAELSSLRRLSRLRVTEELNWEAVAQEFLAVYNNV